MKPAIAQWFDAAVAAWFDWMFSMGWQVAALVGVLAVACRLLQGRSARLRYSLWLLVLLRLVLPPSLAFVTGLSWWLLPPIPTPTAPVTEPTVAAVAKEISPESKYLAANSAQVVNGTSDDVVIPEPMRIPPAARAIETERHVASPGPFMWRHWLLGIWAAIAGVLLGRLGLGIVAARTLVVRSQPVLDDNLRLEIDDLRRELGIRRTVEVRTLTGVTIPMVVGAFRSCIILPAQIEQRLDIEELRAVLLHELQHVARHDALTNLAQAVMAAFYFFHPAVWWTNRQLDRLREDACDEATVAALRGRRRAYCSGMVKIAEMLVGPPPRLALGVAESGLQVKRRLQRILDPRLPVGLRLRWTDWLVVLAMAAVLLPAAAQPVRPINNAQNENDSIALEDEKSKENLPLQASTGQNSDEAASKADRTLVALNNADDLKPKPNAKSIRVSGQVVGPDGEFVEGAEITVWFHFGYDAFYGQCRSADMTPKKPRFGAFSDKQGQFHFEFAESEVDENPMNIWGWPGRHALVVAAAKGYGPAWGSLEKRGDNEFTLKLVKDDVPVQGRVVDLQGRPVEGASVDVDNVRIGEDQNHWLWQTTWAGQSKDVRTDADGRFSLNGIGRGRMVALHIDAPTIEHQYRGAHTPADDGQTDAKPILLEVVAGPTKPFEGVIRAKDTGQPLTGVVVIRNEEKYRTGRRLFATTDAQGRYRLLGVPKDTSYSLSVVPPRDLGYLPTFSKVADSEGLKPIAKDFELRRGVQVRCRYIDKVTREPVWGGDLHYTPLAPNPHFADVDEGYTPNRECQVFYAPDGEGYYRFVAWPGLGMLGFMPQAVHKKYLPTVLTPADKERAKGDPHLGFLEHWVGGRFIEPNETDKTLDLEIELDPGKTVSGIILGPDSKPVVGAKAYGLNYSTANSFVMDYGPKHETQDLKTENFTALRLESHVPRTISFIHHEDKLIGHAVLKGDQTSPLIISARSWGTIAGRIVDADGKPIENVRVTPRYPSLPAPGIIPAGTESKTDQDGRFQIDGILPGCELELALTAPEKHLTISAPGELKSLVITPGQSKELGEIKVQLASKESSKNGA